MRRWMAQALVVALVVSGPMPGCGSGGGGSTTPPTGGGGLPPPAQPSNPCPTSIAAQEPETELSPAAVAGAIGKRYGVYGDTGWTWLDGAWTHEVNRQRLARSEQLGLPGVDVIAPLDEDVGDIAILVDNGELVTPVNTFDLRGRGLRMTPRDGGGFDVAATDGAFRMTIGSRVTLSDDDSTEVGLAFAFPFYGQPRTSAFVNSDGNVTFGEGDSSSTARNVSRLLTGPPRVSLFLSDLDPSAGGLVFVNAAQDAFTVTYCAVRGFESQFTVTAQVSLLPSGAVEMRFGDAVSIGAAVVGLSPGRTSDFTPLDLSASGSAPGGALGERFSQTRELDTVAISRRFYASHADLYDQLVIWTDRRAIVDAFAYETTVRNDIRGLGIDTYDVSASYGGRGRLSSLVVMDLLAKYPDDPSVRFLGENNTVSVIGQETGHRWLVFLRFRDQNGRPSQELLGRDLAHWSFFADSDASVMEGNDIEDLGGGSFRTVGAVSRFSLMDQYAMGLVAERDVPPTFIVEDPRNINPAIGGGNEAEPRTGVTFSGTRRDVSMADIVAVMGTRRPTASESPKVHRQAFIYVVSQGSQADPADVGKLDRFRRAWEDFYAGAVERRGRVETRLRPPS